MNQDKGVQNKLSLSNCLPHNRFINSVQIKLSLVNSSLYVVIETFAMFTISVAAF